MTQIAVSETEGFDPTCALAKEVVYLHIFRPQPTRLGGMKMGIDWQLGSAADNSWCKPGAQVAKIEHTYGSDHATVVFDDGTEIRYVGGPMTVICRTKQNANQA